MKKKEPNTPQNLAYLKECHSCRNIIKGFGGISQGSSISNRLLVSYTCSGYNSDWCGLDTSLTRFGIKFNMVRDSIKRLVVIAKMQDTSWKLEVVTPTNTDNVVWDIADDTKDYFYIYRAFLSSIFEFISVLRTQSQMFNEFRRIVFKKGEN